MIISRKHKFAFLHPRKCAGTSIKVAFSPYLGPNDIVVGSIEVMGRNGKKFPRNLFLKAIHPYNGLRAFKPIFHTMKSYKELCGSVNKNVKTYYKRKYPIKNPDHTNFVEFNKYFRESFPDVKTVSVVRNPFTHALSSHKFYQRSKGKRFKQKNTEKLNFADYLKQMDNLPDDSAHKGFWNHVFDGQERVDEIMKFESLNDDLMSISEKFIGEKISFDVHTRKTKYSKHYSHHFTDEDVALVKKIYARELEYFDYEFEDQR